MLQLDKLRFFFSKLSLIYNINNSHFIFNNTTSLLIVKIFILNCQISKLYQSYFDDWIENFLAEGILYMLLILLNFLFLDKFIVFLRFINNLVKLTGFYLIYLKYVYVKSRLFVNYSIEVRSIWIWKIFLLLKDAFHVKRNLNYKTFYWWKDHHWLKNFKWEFLWLTEKYNIPSSQLKNLGQFQI